eukprot:1486566-Prymnesium_polylepis.2
MQSVTVLLDGGGHDLVVVLEARRRVTQSAAVLCDGGGHDRVVVPEAVRRVFQRVISRSTI